MKRPSSEAEFETSPNKLIKHRLNLQGNLRRLQNQLPKRVIGEEYKEWGKGFLPVHGTSIEKFEQIVETGSIQSYDQLKAAGSQAVQNGLENATDDLDVKLGLHQYVFFNIGRVNPTEFHPVYLVMENDFIKRPGNLVALKEIVHHGALVSPQARAVHKNNNPNANIRKINRRAAKEFFESVVEGKHFPELFGRFLQQHYSQNVHHYLSAATYPGETLREIYSDGIFKTMNFWEGPQLKVPQQVDFSDVACVLITSLNEKDRARVRATGIPEEKIFEMSEVTSIYKQQISQLPNYQNGNGITNYPYVNLALKDLACLAPHNRYKEDFVRLMNGFRERAGQVITS